MRIIYPLLILTLLTFSSSAEILEVYPNPYNEEEEYVKISCQNNCTFTDFEKEFSFGEGIHYIAKNSTAFYKKFGFYPDAEGISLANSGEEIVLRDGTKVDVFNWAWLYTDEGIIYFKRNGSWDFKYEGWSSFKPVADFVSGKFILCPCDYKIEGEGIVYSYTIYDVDTFRGNFSFAVDASPAGGIPMNVKLLSGKIYFLSSEIYRNFHAKFAVVGDKVVVTTENWKWNKRGVVVEFESERISEVLREVFYSDVRFSTSPKTFGKFVKTERGSGKTINFEGRVTLYVMPDENPIFGFIRKAKSRLYVVAPAVDFEYFNGTPLLDELVKASERGVEVKVLVSYGDLNFLESYGIDVEYLRSPRIHGKYMISDESVLVTSANLNKYGLKLNREIALIIEDKNLADELAENFMKDFRKGFDPKSYLLLLLSALTFLLTSTLLLRRKQL